MKFPFRRKTGPVAPPRGYDQWSDTYDTQPDNAVLALESALFTELLQRVDINGRVVLDVGCGTGRHWSEILSRNPARLLGADPSQGMLEQLKSRVPDANVICTEGDRLTVIPSDSIDIVVSTLALAHIRSASQALEEWSRVLHRGGSILITDFHADAAKAGMKRTFESPGGTIEIEQHTVELDRLRSIAADCGLAVAFVAERAIDESVRTLFRGDAAQQKYQQYFGLRLVFGIHLTKP